MRKILLLLAFLSPFLYCPPACANNISVSNASLQEQDTTAHTRMIKFDISWANSWRDTVNYDAAWVFVKYSTDGGTTWSNAWLSTTAGDHTIPANFECKVGTTTITSTARGMGLFLQRDSGNTTAGTVTLSGVKLMWKYGDQGVTDANAALAYVRIMAIEMVYVPTGTFSVGDGSSSGAFYPYNTSSSPYTISSEAAINVGNTTGYLYYSASVGDRAGPVPADFPKGYAAFYIMKYEASQGQYADFLNVLTRTQQGSRVATNISTDAITNIYVMSDTATTTNADRCVIVCPSSGNGTTAPITFSTTRADRACNWPSWADLIAYADWAGLRPFTELEFEKACRGTATPVANGYPWGSTNITNTTTISGTENGTETITTTNANCNYNNQTYSGGDGGTGPLRCGIFAKSGTTREQAGASYYGVMELAGNCREHAVGISSTNQRVFTGLHGDGSLDGSGNADVTNWPATYGALRGTNWYVASTARACTSDRDDAPSTNATRTNTYGIRCARTAP